LRVALPSRHRDCASVQRINQRHVAMPRQGCQCLDEGREGSVWWLVGFSQIACS
jgi:hypothetical protein